MNSLYELLEQATTQSYPPYNISVVDDKHTTLIEVAVSGFTQDELELSKDGLKLTLTGKKNDSFREERKKFKTTHNGLAFRDFIHTWRLTHEVNIVSVVLKNGILSILLSVPDEMKPKKINIESL